MFTPKGKFSWYEIMTSDPKATGKFYSDVVGWTTQEMPLGMAPRTPPSTSVTLESPACCR
jgi:predicted enzyme related to lactoylglutathione lyase